MCPKNVQRKLPVNNVMFLCGDVHRAPVRRRYRPTRPHSRHGPSDGRLPIYHRAKKWKKWEGTVRSIDEARRHGHPSMKGVLRAAPGHHSLPFRWSATAGFIRPGYPGPVHRAGWTYACGVGYHPSELHHFAYKFFFTGRRDSPRPLMFFSCQWGPSHRSIPVIIATWSTGHNIPSIPARNRSEHTQLSLPHLHST